MRANPVQILITFVRKPTPTDDPTPAFSDGAKRSQGFVGSAPLRLEGIPKNEGCHKSLPQKFAGAHVGSHGG